MNAIVWLAQVIGGGLVGGLLFVAFMKLVDR